jgi:hypothetical protein
MFVGKEVCDSFYRGFRGHAVEVDSVGVSVNVGNRLLHGVTTLATTALQVLNVLADLRTQPTADVCVSDCASLPLLIGSAAARAKLSSMSFRAPERMMGGHSYSDLDLEMTADDAFSWVKSLECRSDVGIHEIAVEAQAEPLPACAALPASCRSGRAGSTSTSSSSSSGSSCAVADASAGAAGSKADALEAAACASNSQSGHMYIQASRRA